MDSIARQLILQGVLILINAFFAMTEIAVISLNTVKLRKLSGEGDKTAVRLLKLIQEPAGFLSTIQVGITLAGFLGSAFAADRFSQYLVNWVYVDLGFTQLPLSVLDNLAVIIITIILSYFTLIFGELVPKRIAMQKPMEVARASSRIVSWLAVAMRPIVTFLAFSTNIVLRILRMKPEAEEENVTEEEIRMMVNLGEEKGTIEREEREWIDNVFEFGETTAREVMTHVSDLMAFSSTQDHEEIRKIIAESGLSRFPVYGRDMDNILGILNVREFLLYQDKEIREFLRPAYFVPASIHAANLFRDMQKQKIHIAIVVSEYGETMGIVTMEDLLEEIVGNIYDEFDPAVTPQIIKISENSWRISGSTPMEDMMEELDLPLPEELDYDTLGGMIFSCLNTIPEDGASLELDCQGLHIKVEQIEDRRVKEAVVEKREIKKECVDAI